MLPSRLPSPSTRASQQENCFSSPGMDQMGLGQQRSTHAAAVVPWSSAECDQLTKSLLSLSSTRVCSPGLYKSSEKDGLLSINPNCGTSTLPNPSTPLPNIGKRRKAITNLSRTAPHPSHSVRMAQIFHDAASEIQQSSKQTSRPDSTPANTKRSRIPFLSARRSVSRRTNNPDEGILASPTGRRGPERASPTRSELINAFPTPPLPRVTAPPKAASRPGREPISSGFSSPIKSPVRRTDFNNARTTTIPTVAKETDKNKVSTPFEEPVASILAPSRVDEWLNGVLDIPPILCSPTTAGTHDATTVASPIHQSTSLHPPHTPLNLKHCVSTTSDKENIPPSTIALSWSSIASAPPRKMQSKQGRTHSYKVPPNSPQRKPSGSSSTFSIRDLPRRRIARTPAQIFGASDAAPLGLLTNAPRRKKAKINPLAASSEHRVRSEGSQDSKTISDHGSAVEKENAGPFEDFSEAENECFERITRLSPKVEVFRKGRGPRKERCEGYWDEDILGGRLQDARGGRVENEDARGSEEVFEFSMEKGFTRRATLGELKDG